MINFLKLYKKEELNNLMLLAYSKRLNKSGALKKEELESINNSVKSKYFHPSIFLRILYFVFSVLGMSTLIGPIGLGMSNLDVDGLRFICVLLGLGLWILVDQVLIKSMNHYKSGVTEAGLYVGFSFLIGVGLSFRFDSNFIPILIYLAVGLVLTFRYLNYIGIVIVYGAMIALIAYIHHRLGNLTLSLMPFSMFLLFIGAFKLLKSFNNKIVDPIYEGFFDLAHVIHLMVIYASLNYYVVRELSVEILDLDLSDGSNIPFAPLFYITTIGIPIVYLIIGIKKRSILFIRVALILLAAGVFTLKYYFSLGMPHVSITIAGAILIGLAIWLIKYLKINRNGYTKDELLADEWTDKNVTAFVASQTLGGNVNNVTDDAANDLGGGSFGGGGAGSDY